MTSAIDSSWSTKGFKAQLCKSSQSGKLTHHEKTLRFILRQRTAIETALQDFRGEQRPYYVAVLPAPSERLYVYVLPAQTKAGVSPLGGDVRYLITADDRRIAEKQQLHKSIIEISPNSLPKGATPAGAANTTVLSVQVCAI